MKLLLHTLAVATTLITVTTRVDAQQPGAPQQQAHLTGRVTDGSGGALPGVTITIASPNLATPFTAITDNSGLYTSPALPPDTYSIAFELSSFETRTNS